MISKIDLRKKLLQKRKALETKFLSNLICKKILKNKEYICAKNIFAYYPKAFEVDITPLFEDENKRWFLPKVQENNLKFYEYKFGDELIKGKFEIYEPKENKETCVIPDLIIIPALSVDINNNRLGYGKGYYDRYLVKFSELPIIMVPMFSKLIVEKLPAETHDIKINIVITE